MKKYCKSYLAVVLICMIAFSGCSRGSSSSSSPSFTVKHTQDTEQTTVPASDEKTEDKQTQTTADQQEEVTETSKSAEEPSYSIQTDDSAVITQNADGSFNAVFGDGLFSMTFPASWADRIIIDDYKIYCKLVWDSDPGNKRGKMLSLFLAEDEDISSGIPDSYLLGTSSDKYVIAFTPTDVSYDPSDNILNDEYGSLFADIESVIFSARCSSSPEFTPIDIGMYYSPYGAEYSLAGSWDLPSYLYSEVQFAPYITFREKDGAFGYSYALNGSSCKYASGKYLININTEDYQWNSENWGDFGLVFLDGAVYRFTYYATAPGTLSFEKIVGNSEYDDIVESWVYSSEFQDFDADYNDY